MNANIFERLYQIVFASTYKGYVPNVIEAPNGDGRLDVAKRYAHVARKYMESVSGPDRNLLEAVLIELVDEACDEAARLDIPKEFYPTVQDSTLRLLEYPPGSISSEHTDFDLFTINLYRSHPGLMVPGGMHVHYGELAEIVTGGRLKATSHHVDAHPTQTQRAAVFFAMPPLDAKLPTGATVLEWLTERKSRSRVYK